MKKKKSYKAGIIILLIGILAIAAVVYFGFFADRTRNSEEQKDPEQQSMNTEQDTESAVSSESDAEPGEMDPEETEQEEEVVDIDLPWEDSGKQPEEYTWEDFEALDAGQQIAFQDAFTEEDGFDQWLQKNEPVPDSEEIKMECPWENGGKQPEEYTWEEFTALDGELQILFQSSFKDTDGFAKWLEVHEPQSDTAEASDAEITCPWDVPGAKQPEAYTWEEFNALEGGLQILFQSSFAEEDGFDKWLSENEPQ